MRAAVLALSVLAAGSAGGAVVSPQAQAAPAAWAQVRVAQVYAVGAATATGTIVRSSIVVESSSTTRQPARTLRLYLTKAGKNYLLGTAQTPALNPGATTKVSSRIAAPAVPAGRYAVRACLGRFGSQVCRVSSPGVKITPARLDASPATLSFGDTAVGDTSTPQPVTITNTGRSRSSALTLALSGEDSSDFTTAGTCDGTRLAPGSSCTTDVTFAPQAPGASTATLTVSDGGTATVAVPLSGDAIDATTDAAIDPATWDFGPVVVGQSVSKTFRFVNNTDTDAMLTGGNLRDNEAAAFQFDYADGQNSCLNFVIPANGSCTFSVGFSPSQDGPASATAAFSGDSIGEATSALSGTGVASTTPVRPAARSGAQDYLRGADR